MQRAQSRYFSNTPSIFWPWSHSNLATTLFPRPRPKRKIE